MRLFVAFLTAAFLFAQPPVAAQNRLRAVEAGLTTTTVLKGRPVPRYTIEERMRALNVRGISIAVIDDYKIDWAKGYGFADLESKRPVNTETLFQAGSISKPVAAIGAMKLVEQGKLRLDDDVNSRLKSWKVPDNDFTREQKVTLRRLLSHSAGLTVHGFPGYAAEKPVPSVVDILDGKPPANTAAIRVDITPGSRFRYSGGGYTVMQLLMADVAGKPFDGLLQELVLKPVGMKHSTYAQPLPAKYAAAAASGYKPDGSPVPGRFHTYPEMAAAGLWTTASDLARFTIEIQKAREGRSNRILTKATVDEMLREQMKPYGLGFGLEEKNSWKRFGHGGADMGFQALLSSTMDGKGFVIMANSDNGINLANEIALAIAAAYGWPDKPRERDAITLSAAALQKFAGTYQGPRVGKGTVRVNGDHLTLTWWRGEVDLYPASELSFFPLTPFPEVTFVETGGKVTACRVGDIEARRIP
jgi:CubicO group peptidase (beta-lactamase class C family)